MAVTFLSGGAVDYIGFFILLLALFTAITGCESGAASTDKSVYISI